MFPLSSRCGLSKITRIDIKATRDAIRKLTAAAVYNLEGREPTGAEVGKVPLTARVAVDVMQDLQIQAAVGVTVALKSCVPTESVWVGYRLRCSRGCNGSQSAKIGHIAHARC